MKKLLVPLLSVGMVIFADVSYAAFGGSRSSAGVSRSAVRSAPPVNTRSPTRYQAPTRTSSENYGASTNYGNRNDSPTSSNRSFPSSYPSAPRQNSALRDIGVTAAGVAGGILTAQAIHALISSPSHPGVYTHPQYPGQYFNQQGQPVPAPTEPTDMLPQQEAQLPPKVAQYSDPAASGFTSAVDAQSQVLSMLWKWALPLVVIGVLLMLAFKVLGQGISMPAPRRQRQPHDSLPNPRAELADLDSQAMAMFYDFQRNSNNEDWIAAHTRYLPVKSCLSEPSEVLEYQHRAIDCGFEQGQLRATIHYMATLNDGKAEVSISQYWNFEKDNGDWKLIGFEQAA